MFAFVFAAFSVFGLLVWWLLPLLDGAPLHTLWPAFGFSFLAGAFFSVFLVVIGAAIPHAQILWLEIWKQTDVVQTYRGRLAEEGPSTLARIWRAFTR